MRNWFRDIADFFFPRTCLVCDRVLLHNENHLCTHCLLNMPRTGYVDDEDNAMAQLFYGKLPIERAAAYFYFTKGSDYRTLIHRIKYHDEKECGRYLGQMYAREYAGKNFFEGIDYIVPVPLHRSKMRSRGYNQSEWIAQGISDETGIPVCSDALVCNTKHLSQTRKGIYDRYLSTMDVFTLRASTPLVGQHVLLVDDVVTTGATLQSCGKVLLQGGVARLSLFSLAAARMT